MNMKQGPEIPLMKPVVTGTGTGPANGHIGPALGRVDIGGSEKSYIFQAALAGVGGNLSDMKCSIRDDGRVKIEGVVTGSSLPIDADVVFEVKMQELSPPGRFSISFYLPGPVDPRLTSLSYKHGILEVTVMKFRIPYIPKDDH